MLEKKGFRERWSWITGCLSSIFFSVMINGRPRGKVKGTRGLRQGDPLSPFLLIIVTDSLGRLVEKSRVSVFMSHLQFADDTLFFVDFEILC